MKVTKKATGHIRERIGKSGTARQIIINTIDPITGERKRHSETYHCTKKQASEILKEKLQEIDKYGVPQYKNRTIKEYFEYYLQLRQNDLSKTTLSGYRDDVQNRIAPYIGGITLEGLTKQHIRGWISDLESKGYSNKSIKNAYRLLHTAYKYAVEYDMVASNPCTIQLPKQQFQPMAKNIYDEDEIAQVLNAAKNTDMYLMLMILLNLGLRRGELAGLKWQDVDLLSNTVHIRNNRVSADGEIIEKSPKSRSGIRDLPIGGNLAALLLSAKEEDIKNFGETYVITGYVIHKIDGTPFSPDSITQKWERFVEKNKLKPIRLHDLRHTAISHLLANSGDIKAVQQIAGHSNAQTTLDIYAKPVDSKVKNAITELEQLTFGLKQES